MSSARLEDNWMLIEYNISKSTVELLNNNNFCFFDVLKISSNQFNEILSANKSTLYAKLIKIAKKRLKDENNTSIYCLMKYGISKNTIDKLFNCKIKYIEDLSELDVLYIHNNCNIVLKKSKDIINIAASIVSQKNKLTQWPSDKDAVGEDLNDLSCDYCFDLIINYNLIQYGISLQSVQLLNKYNFIFPNILRTSQERFFDIIKSKKYALYSSIKIAAEKDKVNNFRLSIYALIQENVSQYMIDKAYNSGIIYLDEMQEISLSDFRYKTGIGDEKAFKIIAAYSNLKKYIQKQEPYISNCYGNYKQTIKKEIEKRNGVTPLFLSKILNINLSDVEEITNQLIKNDEAAYSTSGIVSKKPSLILEVNKIKSPKKEMVLMRLNGNTLSDIGEKYKVSRERVRQVVAKVISRIENIKEDRYSYYFKTYDFDKNDFINLFDASEIEYNYLSIKYPKGKETPNYEEIDKAGFNCSQYFKNKELEFNIIIDGKTIKKESPSMVSYVASKMKGYFASEELYKKYRDFISAQNLE